MLPIEIRIVVASLTKLSAFGLSFERPKAPEPRVRFEEAL